MTTNRLVVKGKIAAYSSTLFEAVNNEGGREACMKVRAEIEQVMKNMRSSTKLVALIDDPAITAGQLSAMLREVFAACDAALVEVLCVMAERGDIRLLPRVYTAYDDLAQEKLGIVVVEVSTAVALDDRLRALIKEKAAEDFGRDVELIERIDESILGGIIMSANGKRIDASVVSQLDVARETLKSTKMEVNARD